MAKTLQQTISKMRLRAESAVLMLVVVLGFFVAPAQSVQAQTLTVLYSFAGSPDAAYPRAGLTRDKAGNLYGTTLRGGSSNLGTVFKIDPRGTETVFYSFAGGEDGATPSAGLIQDTAGNLYGTTGEGGHNTGTVFKIDPSGTETVLHRFTKRMDGRWPVAGLLRDKAGNLYGTTHQGGTGSCYTSGCGTVFKVSKTGKETVLYSFTGGTTDGCLPYGGVILGAAGNLYGTTYGCGASDYGTVFKISKTGTETVLHSFAGGSSDGAYPASGVIMDAKGNLYGDTEGGGIDCFGNNYGCGSVYKLSRSGTLTVLHNFSGGSSDGAGPYGGLIFDSAGSLYGDTTLGGDPSCPNNGYGCGTVFEIDTSGTETVLYTFCTVTSCPDGDGPFGDVIRDTEGNRYGTAYEGGSDNYGTVWKLTPYSQWQGRSVELNCRKN